MKHKTITPNWNKILGKKSDHKLTIFEYEYCKEKISTTIPNGVDATWLADRTVKFGYTTDQQADKFKKDCGL